MSTDVRGATQRCCTLVHLTLANFLKYNQRILKREATSRTNEASLDQDVQQGAEHVLNEEHGDYRSKVLLSEDPSDVMR